MGFRGDAASSTSMSQSLPQLIVLHVFAQQRSTTVAGAVAHTLGALGVAAQCSRGPAPLGLLSASQPTSHDVMLQMFVGTAVCPHAHCAVTLQQDVGAARSEASAVSVTQTHCGTIRLMAKETLAKHTTKLRA
jgi:hypothetical protein